MPRITSTLTPTKTQIPSFDLSKLHDIKGTASPIISLSFSPDSKMLLSGAGDGVVRIWDVEKGNLLNTITGN
jgi:WD40 repeat protein